MNIYCDKYNKILYSVTYNVAPQYTVHVHVYTYKLYIIVSRQCFVHLHLNYIQYSVYVVDIQYTVYCHIIYIYCIHTHYYEYIMHYSTFITYYCKLYKNILVILEIASLIILSELLYKK